MKRHALKTLEELKRLRALREQRAYEAMLHDRVVAERAAARVDGLEATIAATRSEAILAERQAYNAAVGTALSLSDLSRLQSGYVANEKKLGRLGSELDTATAERVQAMDALAAARAEYQLRQKANTKIGAARDEAKRKADRHRLVIEELISEEAATSETRRR